MAAGENAIGAWLGDGWYRGRMGWNGGFRNLFGHDLSLLAQLELRYADGSVETIATDDSWRAAPAPIIRSGNYDGELYDARLELDGWSRPGHDDSGWHRVVAAHRDPATLVAPEGPPVRCTEEVAPVEVLTTPSGRRVLDFGQNLVGRVRIRVSGASGDHVVIRDRGGAPGGRGLHQAAAHARSPPTSTCSPAATSRSGSRGSPSTASATPRSRAGRETSTPPSRTATWSARVYHTDLERTGWFSCSDPLVERLHENVVWSMRGNFLDIPTDCPQRDERVGWTGDIQVFAPTASFLYDVSGMLSSWLKDVAVDQLPDGTVPWYVPVIPAHRMWTPIQPGAAWGDVATFTPWTLYERFADEGILDAPVREREEVGRARRAARRVRPALGRGLPARRLARPGRPAAGPGRCQRTDRYLVATAYFARSADRLARMAEVLGRHDDAQAVRPARRRGARSVHAHLRAGPTAG